DLKEREDDPAGYLVRYSPSVRATWEDFSNGDVDVSRYVTAMRGEQERMGMPSQDLLPNAYAEDMAARISAAGAEGMTSMLQNEASRWGSAWPQVYGQLAPKMTDIAAVIGSGIPTYAADALASTAGLKTTELQSMIPPGETLKDYRDAVADTFEEFNRSFPVDAARTVDAFNDAAIRLAIRNRQQGMSQSNAVKAAYKDLVSNYELNEFRGVTYRVPNQFDPGLVEDGAEELLRSFYARSASISTEGAGSSEEELRGQFNAYIRDNAYWMTAPDESGLRLYVDGGPVITGNGPVQHTWDEITGAATKYRNERRQLIQESEADQSRALREGLR
ncbi:MAG TPA: hypothetical protein VFO36_09210, partial [Nitrospiraceae bacterium]|nr:hypothetical protein [Nitrospiraceae bacterium]